eukprot:9948470-Alexandrium_andersonii.AAC.1
MFVRHRFTPLGTDASWTGKKGNGASPATRAWTCRKRKTWRWNTQCFARRQRGELRPGAARGALAGLEQSRGGEH